MKFYYRYPDRALAGMAALNPAQRGIYNSVIDLLYSCDGIVPCMTPADDDRIAKSISVSRRTWRKFKIELLALRKIRVTNDGLLDANGVQEERFRAEFHSEIQRKRVGNRWQNYKLAKQFNDRAIPARYYHKIEIENSEIPSPKEHASPQTVDDVEKPFGEVPTTTERKSAIPVSEELVVIMQRKLGGFR